MNIEYDAIIENAMKFAVLDVLKKFSAHSSELENYLVITFKTNLDLVELPSHVKEKFPQEMTIILQHQYENLKINGDMISVDLSFNGIMKNVKFPVHAIATFMDPTVNFGLRFKEYDNDILVSYEENSDSAKDEEKNTTSSTSNDNVIYVDSFSRNKKKL